MCKLQSSLPPRYSDCGQITLLLQALEQELQRLELAVQTAAARSLLLQADEAGLIRWETDLGLSHRPDLTPEGRRAILLAAMDRVCHGTAQALQAYAQRLSGTRVQVQQDYPSYTLTLTVEEPALVDFYSLQHWVNRRLPLHIAGTFVAAAAADTGAAVENS